MANIVNLQQQEYDTVLTQLENLHENAITNLKSISAEIQSLCQKEGGFYAEKISEKVGFLMSCLESEIIWPTETNFEASKMCMDNFAEIVLNVDTACD